MTTPDEMVKLAERVDAAAAGAVHTMEISDQLAMRPEDRGTPLAAIHAAFYYGDKQKGTGDDFFVPFIELDGQAFPPRPKDVPAEMRDVWAAVAEHASHPVVRARLHDLCFTTRHGNGRDHARAAAEAYLEMSDAYPADSEAGRARIDIPLDAVTAVRRALELARRTGQGELAQRALQKGLDHARVAVADPDPGLGVVLGFLECLAADRDCPAEVDDLLEQARARYQGDVWGTVETIQVQLTRSGLTSGQREALYRDTVLAFMKAAEGVEPLIAMTHLERAVELATQHQLPNLRREAVGRLQAMAGTDPGLVRQTVSIELPGEVVEQWLDSITNQQDWQQALAALLASGAPTGRVEENRAMAAQAPTYAPLSFALPRKHLGPDFLPRVTTAGSDLETALIRIELQNLQVAEQLRAEALRRIGEKWTGITEEAATDFIGQSSHVDPAVARALARSLCRHFRGDHEGAAFTALPKVERLARDLLIALGEVVFRAPTASAPGGYVMLGALLDLLERHGLDPSWSRFLQVYLVRQDGVNLRNEALHGTHPELGELQSSMILLAALYLALVTPSREAG